MVNPRIHGVFSSLLRAEKVQVAHDEETTVSPSFRTSVRREEEETVEQKPRTGGRVGQIALDVYEEGDYLIIKAPIAGVKLSDLDIDVAGNVVTIRGERKQTDTIEDAQYQLQECYWGEFERSVTLPFSANPSRVKATFNKDNILKIFIPREKKVKIVRISEGG